MSDRPDPAIVSDEELMGRLSAGNVESLGDLFDRYCDRAYRVARAVCRDAGRAEDAVQEGFLSVWNSRASYRPQQGTVAAWLLTIVRHRAIDTSRRADKHASRRTSDDQLRGRSSADLADPAATALKREQARRLQASLARLPDAQAEVITLAYFGQLSHTEIATQLGLPAGTVKGRMRLGLQKLRAEIRQAVA